MAKEKVFIPKNVAIQELNMIISQTGTNDPDIVILYNSIRGLDPIIATRNGVGDYKITMARAIDDLPVTSTIENKDFQNAKCIQINLSAPNEFSLSQTTFGGADIDGINNQTCITVKLFNNRNAI